MLGVRAQEVDLHVRPPQVSKHHTKEVPYSPQAHESDAVGACSSLLGLCTMSHGSQCGAARLPGRRVGVDGLVSVQCQARRHTCERIVQQEALDGRLVQPALLSLEVLKLLLLHNAQSPTMPICSLLTHLVDKGRLNGALLEHDALPVAH